MKHIIASLAVAVAIPFVAAFPLLPPFLPKPCNEASNPFSGKTFYLAPNFTTEVHQAVQTIYQEKNASLASKASKVADVSTFIWLDQKAVVPQIGGFLWDARLKQLTTFKPQVVQLVVYDIPDRDCSAGASAGEFIIAQNGQALYQEFIDSIVQQITPFPDVQVVIELEPDAVGNMVTNQDVPKCGNAATVYKASLAYAIAHLSSLPNVEIYVDAAHDGWLGWPANLQPTADYLASLLQAAQAINPQARVRGVGTNVSNYNGLGNQPEQGYDELAYARNLAPLLTANNYPAHFIVDQGRSGNQNVTRSGTDWCNYKYAGLGPRPSTQTPDPVIDAIVWVKTPGQSDGTSDPSSARYDPACNSPTSLVPAPEAGDWFEAQFEQLVTLANPPF